MFLKQLNLTNFRNYTNLELNFDERPTIFVGNNAEGKSNILEAIYLLSTSKSLRAETEEEMIKTGEKFLRIEGFAEDTELMIIINSEIEQLGFKKKIMVNGLPKRTVDFIGNLPAVIFYPSDINLVTGSPSLRRWHLDLCIAQVDSVYKKTLTEYEQFLTSRNRVLKRIREGEAKTDELDYWTDELVKRGLILNNKRKAFFELINSLEKPLGEFVFEYLPSEISVEKLNLTQVRETAAATTLIGPHRDDFLVQIRNSKLEIRNLSKFGSRGEQRTATLAFKLMCLEYMGKIMGKRPILLLDDVFSELDANHRAAVAHISTLQQTIIATVELENIPKDFLDSARILKVGDGVVTTSS